MEIYYSKQAEKFLKKQRTITRNRIRNAIQNLPAGDVKKLQGMNGYRLKVGNYRIIFSRNGDVLYIERIDNRGQIYKEV
ncbi:MAG: type II toxin-antitoxin system RelE/ParE family toxin [Lachnospiraceae bacterium]|nr:type II toxin-antitoxin system RelE/ParE family toxin [Lachnospiraceae bacterium]